MSHRRGHHKWRCYRSLEQTVGRGNSWQQGIKPGDDIVYVNGYTDAESMLKQCKEQAVLKMTVRAALGGAIWYV